MHPYINKSAKVAFALLVSSMIVSQSTFPMQRVPETPEYARLEAPLPESPMADCLNAPAEILEQPSIVKIISQCILYKRLHPQEEVVSNRSIAAFIYDNYVQVIDLSDEFLDRTIEKITQFIIPVEAENISDIIDILNRLKTGTTLPGTMPESDQ